jgi:hypothetical protein
VPPLLPLLLRAFLPGCRRTRRVRAVCVVARARSVQAAR